MSVSKLTRAPPPPLPCDRHHQREQGVAHWVLASNGRPFSDWDAACIKRDTLLAQLGAEVTLEVVSHPDGGYAVACSRPNALPAATKPGTSEGPLAWLDQVFPPEEPPPAPGARESAPARASVSQPAAGGARASTKPGTPQPRYPDTFRMSPAARAFLGQHVLALLGAYLLFRPHDLFLFLGLGLPHNPQLAAVALGSVMLASMVLALVSLSRFLWMYTANTYVVDRTGVEQVQWYFERGRLRRRAPRVNFAHLRTADVDQTVMQMLLDVGTLRLASGATDTYELDLRQVGSPRRLQIEFQRRLREATGFTSGGRRDTDL